MLEQQLAVGRTYRFTFKSEFERHGFCQSNAVTCLHKGNGIFRLEEIATFKDIVLSGVDLYGSFFKPLGISEDEYKQYFSGKPMDRYEPLYTTVPVETEKIDPATGQKFIGRRQEIVETGKSKITRHFLEELSYGSFPIYKLVDVVDQDDVIYAPEKAILGFPEVGIKEYQNVTLAIDIGYWEDPTNLDGMLFAMRERLAIFGIQPLRVSLFSADSLWMNPDEYAEMKSLKVPGQLVQITPANQADYIGHQAIIDGQIYTLVANYPTDAEGHEVREGYKLIAEVITRMNQCRDPGGFIDKKANGDPEPIDWLTDTVFESTNLYYVKETLSKDDKSIPGFRKLVEGEDWAAGDKIEHFKQVCDLTVEQFTATEAGTYGCYIGNKYEDIPSGDKYLERVLGYVDANVPVYYAETVESEIKHTQVDRTFVQHHPEYQYCICVSTDYYETIWCEVNENLQKDGKKFYFLKQDIFKANFASDYAVSLVAKKFIYTNRMGSKVTTELSEDQIVNISMDESHEVRISNDVVRNKYSGRWFEFTDMIRCGSTPYSKVRDANRTYYIAIAGGFEPVDPSDPRLPEIGSVWPESQDMFFQQATYATRISVAPDHEEDYKIFSDKPGVVLGEIGEIYRETFIKDDSLNRNYFALYHEQLQQSVALTRENASLRALVDKLSADLLKKG